MISCRFFSNSAWELIDTLWNVNNILKSSEDPEIFELIDTLWNVNYFEIIQLQYA